MSQLKHRTHELQGSEPFSDFTMFGGSGTNAGWTLAQPNLFELPPTSEKQWL